MSIGATMPRSPSRTPLGVIAGLAAAIVLDTLVQLCWKIAVSRSSNDATPIFEMFRSICRQPMAYILIALILVQFINWIAVLKKADLGFAQPITAASYVLTAMGSAAFFNDRIPPMRWCGIAFILAGVWFITRSEHRTEPRG